MLENSFFSINMKTFMANVGKKVSLFSMLSFCFAKSDLRVWEDIWRKNWSKSERYRGKDLKLICVEHDDIDGEIGNKKVKNDMGIFFVIQRMVCLPNVFFFATFSQIDVKNWEI